MTAMEIEGDGLWRDLDNLLLRKTPFGSETGALPMGEFQPGEETKNFLREEAKVLVVGAGGLGSEILKDLALSGFRDITVIDMDNIDVSNLNRQFLFRQRDVGKPKAEVAADFVQRRVEGVKVTAVVGKIQDQETEFYQQFNAIISGLDNIEARRWLNSLVHSLVELDEDGDPLPETIIPLIDGGTEGFKGQARVIIPKITSCFECSLDAFPPQQAFPMCTIAETPRVPEHCIAYVYVILWPKEFPDKKLDKDSPEHMHWIYERAKERAESFGIPGVTYMLTLGVVKNIIPAVASTNALISAICVNEVFKALTFCSQTLNTYHMYMGNNGVYPHTFVYGRKEACTVCVSQERSLRLSPSSLLKDLLQKLSEDSDLRLKKPSLTKPGANLFMQGPPALREATLPNLEKPLRDLLQDGEIVTVTDPVFVGDLALHLKIEFEG